MNHLIDLTSVLAEVVCLITRTNANPIFNQGVEVIYEFSFLTKCQRNWLLSPAKAWCYGPTPHPYPWPLRDSNLPVEEIGLGVN